MLQLRLPTYNGGAFIQMETPLKNELTNILYNDFIYNLPLQKKERKEKKNHNSNFHKKNLRLKLLIKIIAWRIQRTPKLQRCCF